MSNQENSNSDKFETKRVKIHRRRTTNVFVEKYWIFAHSDDVIFRTMCSFNRDWFNWVDNEKESRLSMHIYGFQIEPVPCEIPSFVNDEDLETLTSMVNGYLKLLDDLSGFINKKIDWEIAREHYRQHVVHKEEFYCFLNQLVSSTIEIVCSWVDVLSLPIGEEENYGNSDY